jgi:hypothetical protein
VQERTNATNEAKREDVDSSVALRDGERGGDREEDIAERLNKYNEPLLSECLNLSNHIPIYME